ncbi:DUF805 domain-containing protein [Blastococcus sp. TF02-9]|uniref:DUF805 domain-containing protein n=1 Tax=Blastococcus sp. TF02-09 TaxID=2250576 RepID=UPI001314CA06|nr:DUF805 domain-containing protein [Blastococcus sp. TF02-9]
MAGQEDMVKFWDWYVPRGRVSRQEFWLKYVLPSILLSVLAAWADGALGLPTTSTVSESGAVIGDSSGPLSELASVFLFVPGIASFVTRLHDQGDSAWLLLLALIPLVGVLLLIVFVLFIRGGNLPNRYGPAPAPMRWPWLGRALRRADPSHDDALELEAQRR